MRKRRKIIALILLQVMLLQIFEIPAAYALTSGPSQPEVQSFEPAGTTEMVDLFSGDFTYNIPLFELPGPNGGYPFNLAYHAGIGMDQEASWVGLGWSLNPGAITRQMRGLPDDFNGDEVVTTRRIKPSTTVGVGGGVGTEIFGGIGNVGIGKTIRYNNYRGIGYSIDGSIGFASTAKPGQSSAGLGLGFSLDPDEGLSLQPSLSLGVKMNDHKISTGLGLGMNSRTGLGNLSVGINLDRFEVEGEERKKGDISKSGRISSSSALNLAHTGYTPQVGMPMLNHSFSYKFSIGGAAWGVHPHAYFRGFFNKQKLAHNEEPVTSNAFGYLNYQNADNKSLLDFNREKDGAIRREAPNLPIPSLTYDIYSVMGQGMAAMYRPIRNDHGQVYDQLAESKSFGESVGADIAPALAKTGVNLSLLHSESRSGKWGLEEGNQLTTDFESASSNDLFEPYYFKAHGEPTVQPSSYLNDVGGEQATAPVINGEGKDATLSAQVQARNGTTYTMPQAIEGRQARSQAVTAITNRELLNGATETLPLFDIQGANRTEGDDHIAGLTALNAEGLRYTYALPVYNYVNEEYQLTADNGTSADADVLATSATSGALDNKGDEFFSKTELPPYAHSYLLTSITGPDYVDRTPAGLGEEDLGYWVKFSYTQSNAKGATAYKWRAPFNDANRIEGFETDDDDDRASFVYGEKETWYLSRAETKSHIADFISVADRKDGRGVLSRTQTVTSNLGSSLRRLSEIILYKRTSVTPQPIKTVKFNDGVSLTDQYELCKNTPNSENLGGKYTLKKLHFEFGSNTRGRLTPYQFEYGSGPERNPDYQAYGYDRWGNYKPIPASEDNTYNIDLPYTDQDPAKRAEIDDHAAAWSLTKIDLPSGGEILVDYESDDYGYVQHMPAMQMMEVIAPPGATTTAKGYLLDAANLRVDFNLEEPVPVAELAGTPADYVKRYLDLDRDLYFRLKMDLLASNKEKEEFVSGYASIDPAGAMGLESVGSDYVSGYFHLKAEDGYHPFSLRAWQHLRTNRPRLIDLVDGDPVSSIKFLEGLLMVIQELKVLFSGFNTQANNKQWGKEVVLDRSRIRLFSPDKIKVGGGLRVKQVTFKDNWDDGAPGIYGQVYQYRTTDDNGDIISSGVAAYEPLIGGEENALRFAKSFTESIPLHSDNHLFFEYPINENYYPGPQVGYSKVTVKSLAAAVLAGDQVNHTELADTQSAFPQPSSTVSFGTTGITEHEFYTARDFPVITDETLKKDRHDEAHVNIPFFGAFSEEALATSQGYSIVTNDMHGKLKKVSNYRQTRSGDQEQDPISWVRYNYLGKKRVLDGREVNELNNLFASNGDQTISPSVNGDMMMGVEHELFTDARYHHDRMWEGGANGNLDILFLLFVNLPVPSVWPNVSKSETVLKSAVTNKVIFKSGILGSIEAYDGGSLVKTENLKWDAITGKVLLSKVNNNFDQDVFSWSRPAYWEYPGMDGAYKNVGLKFSMTSVTAVDARDNQFNFAPDPSVVSSLYPGDELIVSQGGNAVTKATYIGVINGSHRIYSTFSSLSGDYDGHIWRSGHRNHLSSDVGSITALSDPSSGGNVNTYQKTVLVPTQN